MTDNKKALTHSLGDKLKLVVPVETSAPKRKRNPRSGVDFPDLNTPLSRDEISEVRNTFQQKLEDMRDKNNEANTASQNLQNNKETHMTQTNIETNNSLNNGRSTNADFDSRALSVAESAVRSIEKVAHEGITVRPAFKKRDALGSAILGGAIGGIVGGTAAATAMAFLPEARTNGDVLNAGALGFGAGAMIGAGIGYVVGSSEPKDPSKK